MYPSGQSSMSMDYLPNDLSGHRPAIKPARPLTSYHLYFQLEREHLIQTSKSTDVDDDEIVEDCRPLGLEIDPYMPSRYHNIHLSQHWYATGKSAHQKRKHRKTHGKVAFLDLSKHIASKWATLEETDPDIKQYCARIAKRELDAYKEKVKLYKASNAPSLTSSLLSSLSSTDTGSSSPTFDEAANLATRTSSDSFQVYSGLHLERMEDNLMLPPERPTKWARSCPNPATAITNGDRNSSTDPTLLSEWFPKSISGWMDNTIIQSPTGRKNSVASAKTTNASQIEAGNQSKSKVSEPMSGFSFHPVDCGHEDSFLKKYRKAARRTSLFSIRPLQHQVVPLQQLSSDNGTAKSNINANDMMEYESITNEPSSSRGFGSIQRKLRNELDERVSRIFKGGWTKEHTQSPPTISKQDDAKKMAGQEILSPPVSEANGIDLSGFTYHDAEFLVNALSDKRNSEDSMMDT